MKRRVPPTRAILLAMSLMRGADPAGAATLRVGVSLITSNAGNPYQDISQPIATPAQAIFDALTAVDEAGTVTPALAISWTLESPTSWLVRLRPGIVFSNGEPLTAEALVVSAQHMATVAGRTETVGSMLYQVVGAEAVDALTARVRMSEPDPLFPLHAALWRIPAPKQWQTLTRETYRTAIGTGPFVATARTSNAMTLRANSQSWRRPRVDELQIRQVADATSRVQALTSGAIDIALNLAPEDEAAVTAAGFVFHARPSTLVHFLGFVTTDPTSPLRDARVRRALTMAVNREAIVRQVLKGTTAPASQFAARGSFGYNAALEPLPYDPAAATRLLREAGFPSGLKLAMTTSIGRGSDALYYQQIAADLAKVGVALELRTEPAVKLNQTMFAGTWTTNMFNMYTRGLDAMTDDRFRACLGLATGRAPYHCDPELLPLLRRAIAEQDVEARRRLYGEVAAFEQRSPPGLLLWQDVEFDGLSPRVQGYAHAQDTILLDRVGLTATSVRD